MLLTAADAFLGASGVAVAAGRCANAGAAVRSASAATRIVIRRLDIAFECTIGRSMAPEQPVLAFSSKDEFAAWMDANHADSDGIWIKFAKKGTGTATIVYPEAIEVALCYGWIDGQVKRGDETWY